MRVCVVSFKECWQDETSRWFSSGGFPAQMAGIASLFDAMTLVIVRGVPRPGGQPLPRHAVVVPVRPAPSANGRGSLSLLTDLAHYLPVIVAQVYRADAVHVPLPGPTPLVAMLVAFLLRKPIVARYGGSWATNTRTTLMNRLTRACMRLLAGGKNVMLATGSGTYPPAPRMHWVFATALSDAELRGVRVPRRSGLGTPPRLVYVGRLSPEKGLPVLFRALARLLLEGFTPLPMLTLVGDGPERNGLERLARELGCAHLLTFAGQLDRGALAAQLAGADLCVQPSLTEGYSKAWLDAFARGVPVLASDVGAARVVMGGDGERGWVVQPGDVESLAATLRDALTAPVDWPALRERCRSYAQTRTIEVWSREVGEHCGRQWGARSVDGKLEW